MTKIVITGTHSTGKTTLAKKISEELKIPFIRGDKAIELCSTYFPGQSINALSVEDA